MFDNITGAARKSWEKFKDYQQRRRRQNAKLKARLRQAKRVTSGHRAPVFKGVKPNEMGAFKDKPGKRHVDNIGRIELLQDFKLRRRVCNARRRQREKALGQCPK